MKTVTVTIGRNINDQPMSQYAWDQFNYDVLKAVQSYTSELWANAVSRSQWTGVPEDSRVFYGPLRANLRPLELSRLRARLATLATQYGQEAIGMSVGESELVESYGEREVQQPAFVG
jgi:hypothetical protein